MESEKAALYSEKGDVEQEKAALREEVAVVVVLEEAELPIPIPVQAVLPKLEDLLQPLGSTLLNMVSRIVQTITGSHGRRLLHIVVVYLALTLLLS